MADKSKTLPSAHWSNSRCRGRRGGSSVRPEAGRLCRTACSGTRGSGDGLPNDRRSAKTSFPRGGPDSHAPRGCPRFLGSLGSWSPVSISDVGVNLHASSVMCNSSPNLNAEAGRNGTEWFADSRSRLRRPPDRVASAVRANSNTPHRSSARSLCDMSVARDPNAYRRAIRHHASKKHTKPPLSSCPLAPPQWQI